MVAVATLELVLTVCTRKRQIWPNMVLDSTNSCMPSYFCCCYCNCCCCCCCCYGGGNFCYTETYSITVWTRMLIEDIKLNVVLDSTKSCMYSMRKSRESRYQILPIVACIACEQAEKVGKILTQVKKAAAPTSGNNSATRHSGRCRISQQTRRFHVHPATAD